MYVINADVEKLLPRQQIEGLNFTETYTGVMKTAALRMLFALAAALGWT